MSSPGSPLPRDFPDRAIRDALLRPVNLRALLRRVVPDLADRLDYSRLEVVPQRYLLDDWRKRDPRFREPRLSENLALVDRLETVADRHGTSIGSVAVAWTLANPAVDGAIVGFRRPDQIDPIVGAASLELTDEDLATIEGGS